MRQSRRRLLSLALAALLFVMMSGVVLAGVGVGVGIGGWKYHYGNIAPASNFILLQQGGHILLQQGGALLCHNC